MVKILVTGAKGQLGRELQRLAGGNEKDDAWIFTDVAEFDVADPVGTAVFLDNENPDVVVNCAAWTDVEGAEKDPQGAFRINAQGPRVLASWAAANNASLIHISTDFVFDGIGCRSARDPGRPDHNPFPEGKRTPYTEDEQADPLNVYGKSKLAGEQAVIASGCSGVIIRTSWLYSPYGRNFVRSILEATRRGDELRVVEDQYGSPTAADGLAGALITMIPRLLSSPQPARIYHYCDAGVTSRFGFAREVLRQSGLGSRIIPVSSLEIPSLARRPGYSALDTTKIEHEFGIIPRRWQDSLAQVLTRLNNIQ